MALTLNVVIIVLWISLWVFSRSYSTLTKGTGFLMFFLGFYLFYPSVSTVYGDLHHPGIVLSGIVLLFIILYRIPISKFLYGFHTAKTIFYGWIIWGILAYLPVISIYLIENIFYYKTNERYSNLIELTRDTTIIKTALPTITAVIVMLIPLYALRNVKDFESFWKALVKGTLILLALSLIRYIFYIDFIPQGYESIRTHGYRMSGFSIPDGIGFGRQLLMPILFITSLSMRFPKKMRLFEWITLSLGILCILLTFARTTYVSFLLSILVLLLLSFRIRRIIKLFFLITLMVIIAIYLIGVFQYQQHFVPGKDRLSLSNFKNRITLYKACLKIIAENPFFGAFPGGYQSSLKKIKMEELWREYGHSPHSLYLGIAVEWGIPMAMISLLALLYSFRSGILIIRKIRKKTPNKNLYLIESMAYGVAIVSVAYCIYGLAEPIPFYFLFFNLGLALAIRRIVNSKSLDFLNYKNTQS